MNEETSRTLSRPLIDENPITLQILGICSALAITKTLAAALLMSVSVTTVLVLASASISLIRRHIPHSIRLIIQITIIASIVIVVDQLIQAFAYGLSKQLSIFVGLIITNCIVLGRAESFAMHTPVRLAALDGLGNGLGYSLILIVVSTIRELVGSGTLLGATVLSTTAEGGWYEPMELMLLPPSAFFLIGLLIWGLRSWRTEQIEAAEHEVSRPEARWIT
jgi:Na+-transporting NADH:ubiquinone oxidoreductase subunit D